MDLEHNGLCIEVVLLAKYYLLESGPGFGFFYSDLVTLIRDESPNRSVCDRILLALEKYNTACGSVRRWLDVLDKVLLDLKYS